MINSSYFSLKPEWVDHPVSAFQYISLKNSGDPGLPLQIDIIIFHGINLSICSEIVQDTYIIYLSISKKLRAYEYLWMERFLTAPFLIPASQAYRGFLHIWQIRSEDFSPREQHP
jgi:hypothetical protein